MKAKSIILSLLLCCAGVANAAKPITHPTPEAARQALATLLCPTQDSLCLIGVVTMQCDDEENRKQILSSFKLLKKVYGQKMLDNLFYYVSDDGSQVMHFVPLNGVVAQYNGQPLQVSNLGLVSKADVDDPQLITLTAGHMANLTDKDRKKITIRQQLKLQGKKVKKGDWIQGETVPLQQTRTPDEVDHNTALFYFQKCDKDDLRVATTW
jgi:hypothetical protein